MAEKILSRILVNHGMHGAYPIGDKTFRRRISIKSLDPVGPPRKLNTRPDEHELDDMAVHLWRIEGIEANYFIAYTSPDEYSPGSYIQFYNVK